MGDESLSVVSDGSIGISIRQRRPSNPDLEGWSFTCINCDYACRIESDDVLIEVSKERAVSQSDVYLKVPVRCEQCAADKYKWLTLRKLKKEIPARVSAPNKLTLATFTLGKAKIIHDEYHVYHNVLSLRREAKDAFRRFIRSKWWRNRVKGSFYTIEVKETPLEDGTVKLHPHIHVLMEHDGYEDWKQAAQERGLGEYTWAKRVRPTKKYRDYAQAVNAAVGYIMKYAMKGYGDPTVKGRYYERTGSFRK